MLFATVLFFLSLFGIVALFALKNWETKRERVLFSMWREQSDLRALKIKDRVLAARKDLAELLPKTGLLARLVVHEAALGFARVARFSERQAHRLADLVSHKRGFERRETRSEFLRKVAERKSETENTL